MRLGFVVGLLALACGCTGPDMMFKETVVPPGSPYTVSASAEPLRKKYYAVTVTVRNGSTEVLALDPTMFELTAPPATFLQLTRLSFGRNAFRMPSSIAVGGAGNGQVFFRMEPGETDPETAVLHVYLPTGDHQVVFALD